MLRPFQIIRQQAWAPAIGPSDDPQAVLMEGAGCYRAIGGGKWHWHDCTVLLVPRMGPFSLRQEDDGNVTWVPENHFMLLPSGRAHRSHPMLAGHSHTAIYVSEDGWQRIESNVGSLTRLRQRKQRATIFSLTPRIRTIHELCLAPSTADSCGALIQKKLSTALLLNCVDQIEGTEPDAEAVRYGHGAALAFEMKAFMTNNPTERVPLDEIASNFRISRRHATRLFRQYTGSSIAEFQQRRQIDKARSLLVETELSISEVAYTAGFQSGSALARAMRRLDNISPSEVRSSRLL
jgi:AraC-like DNA-binding protein